MHSWEVLNLPQAKYISSIFIPPIHASDDNDDPEKLKAEIDRFCDLFGDLADQETACPLETLVYAINYKQNNKKREGNPLETWKQVT